MIAQIPTEILNAVPPKWLVYINSMLIVGAILGRTYQAIRAGGGLVSIWRGLLYGTNTPTPPTNTTSNKTDP